MFDEAGSRMTIEEVSTRNAGEATTRAMAETSPGRDLVDRVRDLADDELTAESTRIAAAVSAAQAELAVMLREIERRELHRSWDCPSIERFASWKCQLGSGGANALGTLGRAIEGLPTLGDAVISGELALDKAIAIARVASAESVDALIDLARHATVEQTRRFCGKWRRVGGDVSGAFAPSGSADQPGDDAALRVLDDAALGRVLVIHDDDGVELRARFDHVHGALVLTSLDAATAQVRAERQLATPPDPVAERAAVGSGVRPASVDEKPLERLDREQWRAQGLLRLCERTSSEAPTIIHRSGFVAEVVVHVPVDALLDPTDADNGPWEGSGAPTQRTSEGSPHRPSNLRARDAALDDAAPDSVLDPSARDRADEMDGDGDDARSPSSTVIAIPTIEPRGVRLRRDAARFLVCDSGLHTMVEDDTGDPLHLGRRRTSITATQRRAVHARDPHCMWPGCTATTVQLHHRHHRVAGGHDDIENLVPLCTWHHGVVHRRSIVVGRGADGTLRFVRSDGSTIGAAAPFTRRLDDSTTPVHPGSTVEMLRARQRALGIDVDAPLRSPQWMNDRFDLSDVIAAIADRRDAALRRTIPTGGAHRDGDGPPTRSVGSRDEHRDQRREVQRSHHVIGPKDTRSDDPRDHRSDDPNDLRSDDPNHHRSDDPNHHRSDDPNHHRSDDDRDRTGPVRDATHLAVAPQIERRRDTG